LEKQPLLVFFQSITDKSVVSQGGGTIQDFDMFALDYDSMRALFLSQYFRNKYDSSLKTYPFIDSRVHFKARNLGDKQTNSS
jgi:cell surface protein SprA